MRAISKFLVLALLPLAACQVYEPTPKPDYTIGVMPTASGMVAIPPTCPSWSGNVTDPYDNQPVPQFGCATARNLALMADNPQDVATGRSLDDTRGVAMVGAIRRYDNNQTRGLIYTSSSVDSAVDITTAPVTSSTMTGDVTGSANSSGASSSSSTPSSSSSTSSVSTGP
jgi:hypothetical protein